jgi:hypothetical protein
MALELGQLYVSIEEKTGVWNTNDGNRHVRKVIPAGFKDKSFGEDHIPKVQEAGHVKVGIVRRRRWFARSPLS